ncbi:MAG: hypothetical protein KAG82_14700 [Alcanivoracaceae bacterium]|nr:hypothetical protein [Alcanivoracaceae bacterium]
MLPNKLLAVLFVAAAMAGCVGPVPMHVDAEEELAAARKAGDHVRALEIVEHISAQHPQYDALIKQREAVLQDIEKHQHARIREAGNLASSGRWQEAFAVMDELDRQWRGSGLIAQARHDLEERQMLRYHQLAADVLVSEAKWIISQQASKEQLRTLTERDANSLVQQLEERQINVAEQMNRLGHYFADRKDWPRTRDLLGNARALSGVEERDPRLTEAERQLAGAAHRQERLIAQRTSQRADTLIEQYRKTESIKDLIAARDYLQSNNQDGSLDEEATRLESLSRERFRAGLKGGDSLYAAGDYAAAEKVWKEVAPLYPNDAELAGKLERVSKVLENLKTLGR